MPQLELDYRYLYHSANTRYEVLYSIAILLKIIANLYVERRNCEYELGANAIDSVGRTHRQIIAKRQVIK